MSNFIYKVALVKYGETLVKTVLKVRKKGVIILPKKLRELVGINEGEYVIVEAEKDKLIMRPLKPKIVDIDLEILEKLLSEESNLERRRFKRLLYGKETGS